MIYADIFRILSSYLYGYTIVLIVPFSYAVYCQLFLDFSQHPQPHTTWAFAGTFVICGLLALVARQLARPSKGQLYRREALVTAVIIWFLTPAIGALPFLLSGTLQRMDQAYFEAVSGFTTTGATILDGKKYDPITHQELPIQRTYCGMQETTYTFYGTVKPVVNPMTGQILEGIEALGQALLFWRSLTQWLGGMGIIVLFVAVLPAFGGEGKVLFQTEAAGPLKEGLAPRMKETALQLWKVYLVLTFIAFCSLLLVNPKLSLFESLTLAFTTISTGGFSIHNENIAFYHHPLMEWVILFLMILGSLNFAFYYQIIRGKVYRLFEPEFLIYMLILLVGGICVIFYLWKSPLISFQNTVLGSYFLSDAIRIGLFQLISAQTSSGFFTANYDTWPPVVQLILIIVMYLGGMSGSTSGGIKMIRIYLLIQMIRMRLKSIFRPYSIHLIHVGKKEIDQATAISVLCFFLISIVLSVATTFLYIADHVDPETAVGLTAAMLNNTGLGFRAAGPTSTLAFLTPFETLLSAFIMILGRLEYYAVLVILIPSFWTKYE